MKLKLSLVPPGKFHDSNSDMATEIPLNYFQCIAHQSTYPSTLLTFGTDSVIKQPIKTHQFSSHPHVLITLRLYLS